LDQCAESSDSSENLGALSAAHEGLDPLDKLVAGVDVNTGVAVGNARAVCHGVIFYITMTRLLTCLACCFFSLSAWAGRSVRVYEVDVKGGQAAAAQSPSALQDAMRQAVVRATGRRESATDPALASLISEAPTYVKAYAQGTHGQSQVVFDGTAVE